MTLLVVPFAGLLAGVPAVLAATITLAERRHARADDHRRELAAINTWLDAIKEDRA